LTLAIQSLLPAISELAYQKLLEKILTKGRGQFNSLSFSSHLAFESLTMHQKNLPSILVQEVFFWQNNIKILFV